VSHYGSVQGTLTQPRVPSTYSSVGAYGSIVGGDVTRTGEAPRPFVADIELGRTFAAYEGVRMTAAEFERLTADEVECLLLRRLRVFLKAGAAPGGALILASQIEVAEDAAVQLLQKGLSADLTLRLLY
jgi:hypothetical protein